ncbi:hypothetical protein EBESD8_10130 [Rhodococcus aetherivorans]|nr:hypothetical protein EBESD8_10130 [Rhodococcus aetherivorans]
MRQHPSQRIDGQESGLIGVPPTRTPPPRAQRCAPHARHGCQRTVRLAHRVRHPAR